MPNVNELQIVNDFLTAGAPKLNGNTIPLGVIPTCETSPVAVSEGSLMGQLLHGYMQSIFLAPMLSAPEKLQQTPGTLAWLRPAAISSRESTTLWSLVLLSQVFRHVCELKTSKVGCFLPLRSMPSSFCLIPAAVSRTSGPTWKSPSKPTRRSGRSALMSSWARGLSLAA